MTEGEFVFFCVGAVMSVLAMFAFCISMYWLEDKTGC